MSFVLPKAAQTQKLNSLPADFRKLAEDLIKDKFKEKEVVPRNSGASFPREGSWVGRRDTTGYNEYERSDKSRYATLSTFGDSLRIYIAVKSEEAIVYAIREMDCRNIPQSNRKLFINMDDMAYLRTSCALCCALWNAKKTGAYATIFGINVYLIERGTSYLEGRYDGYR